MKKVLFTATVDSHILHFHIPYLKLFKENGYEVHVATNGNEEIPYCDKKHIVSFERSPYKINNLKAIKQLKRIIETEKFDIIHCHTPMGSVVTRLASKKARKKYKTRVIYTAHGFHFYKGAPLLNWILFYPIEKWLAKYTDTLITINNEDYELAKKKFSKRCKDIQYVPGVGIDPNKFNIKMSEKEKNDLRKSLGLKKDDFIMIYPAELSKRKRQIWLINTISDLLKEHEDIHLLLPGKDSLNGECQKLVSKLNLDKQIHLLGYRKDIQKLLRISNISVSAANQEGLPVNIMEAMYVGLPIVASNCRGNRDLIEDEENGYLVNINDQNNFIKYIEQVYLSDKKGNKLIQPRKNIIKKYLLNNVINELSSIYYKKKKVLHLLASNQFSGAEKVVCTIIESMKEKYDMFYCSPEGNIKEYLEEKNICYIPIKKLSLRDVKNVIRVYKPDIIHAHDFKASFICALLNKNNQYLVEHIHNNNPWLKKININSLIFLYSAIKANKILTVSNSIKNEYIFSNFVQKKIVCIGNPISIENVLNKVNEKDYIKEYDICCVARLSVQKNPIRFLKIIDLIKEKVPQIKAIWIGNGELKEVIEKEIQELGLMDNITLMGFQKNPYKYLARSKIFLLTSDWEGYGLAAFEALSLGVPAIVSNVGGLPSIVDETCGKLCNNNEEYVDSIIKLLKSPAKLKKYSLNAKKRALLLSNIDDYMNKLSNIYENK